VLTLISITVTILLAVTELYIKLKQLFLGAVESIIRQEVRRMQEEIKMLNEKNEKLEQEIKEVKKEIKNSIKNRD